jgi:glycolate oxidase FAD binding subunit
METMQRITASRNTHRKLTIEATGIGWLRLEATPENLHASLLDLRHELERDGGSLSVFRHPTDMQCIDAWGTPGDALPLMRAVKNQFDPKNTLNPGRFLAGI